MRIISIITGLVFIDLTTKNIFRFLDPKTDSSWILLNGYLWIEEVVFNYGNIFQSSSSPNGVSFGTVVAIYAGFFFGVFCSAIALLAHDESDSAASAAPFVCLISGALGNASDRIVHGNVCDWITLTNPYSAYYFVLNLADIFIWAGLLALPVSYETRGARLAILGLSLLIILVPMRTLFWFS